MAPHRSLLKFGSINVDSGSSVKKREFFLFNDLLIIAKKDGAKLKMLMMAGFDEVSVTEKSSEGLQLDILFRGHDPLKCVFDSVTLKNDWKNLFDTSISEWMTQGLKNRINQAHAMGSSSVPSPTQTPNGEDSPVTAPVSNPKGNMFILSPNVKASADALIPSKESDLQKRARPVIQAKPAAVQGSPVAAAMNSASEIVTANLDTKAAFLKQIVQHPKTQQHLEKKIAEAADPMKINAKIKPAVVKPSPASANAMQKSASGDNLSNYSMQKSSSGDKLDLQAKKNSSSTEKLEDSDQNKLGHSKERSSSKIKSLERVGQKLSPPPRSFSKEQKLEDLISKYPSDANTVRTSISIRAKNEILLQAEVHERLSTTARPKSRTRGKSGSGNLASLPTAEKGMEVHKLKNSNADTEESYVALAILMLLLSLFII